MQRLIVIHLLGILSAITLSNSLSAQTQEVEYYRDKYLSKKTTPIKAKYKQVSTLDSSGVMTITTYAIKKNEVISRQSYLRGLPTGIWYMNGQEVDYNVPLVYGRTTDQYMPDSTLFKMLSPYKKVEHHSEFLYDVPELGYTAPRLDGEVFGNQKLINAIAKNFNYPIVAIENGFSGSTLLDFTVDTTGKITRPVIIRSSNPLLDVEAVRTVLSIKLDGPAMLDGEPVEIYIQIPIQMVLN